MNGFQVVSLLLYLVVLGVQYWLKFINMRHMKENAMNVPGGFEEHIDKETLKKVCAYAAENSVFGLAQSLFGGALLLLIVFGGILNHYNAWISSLALPFIVEGTLFFLILIWLSRFISIPFDLYHTFVIERRYGFNASTLRLWGGDFIKTLFLSSFLYGALLLGGFWIVEQSPGKWWLFVWAFFLFFSLFLMYISPYVIEPLFNKFSPLEGGDLANRIREMMKRCGIEVSRVFTMDSSRRSRHTNAYFTGIGRVKRIVLFDTLVRKMDTGEILAVLAHEAGHWKKKHMVKMIALFEILSFAGLYLAFRILRTSALTELFAVDQDTFFAKMVILGFLSGIVLFPLQPLFNWISRRNEYEADRFAITLSSDSDSLSRALIKLARDNLSNLHPHPLYAKFYYSHPPVVERVGRVLNLHG